MTYRDAGAIFRDSADSVGEAAIAMCQALDIKGETYIQQAECFAAALLMYQERNGEVHDAWRAVGYLGNLLTLYGKVIRLMKGLWWHSPSDNGEKPLDNAIDALNYTAFFIRGFSEEDERGERR